MKPIIYLIQELNPEHILALKENYPAFDFYTKAEGVPPERKKDVEIILGGTGADSDEIMSEPNHRLKWIQGRAAGTDFWDLEKLQAAGVMLSNAAGLHGQAIAEHVIGMLLLDVRDFRNILRLQAEKRWGRELVHQQPLLNQNMLIIGVGRVGSKVGEIAAAFGINVFGLNLQPVEAVGFKEIYSTKQLAEILPQMDIVVNTLPLLEETTHFYNEDFFNQVKKSTKFVNVGRGPSVDTEALIKAIDQGQISYAYLDVFEGEPLPVTSPLWERKEIIISPHVAGMIPKFKSRLLAEIFLPNLESYQYNGELKINRIV